MHDYKVVSTPMTSTVVIESSSPNDSIVLYRRIIGKFHYLSFTRPGIAYVIHMLSQAIRQPFMSHWIALKRILRYLYLPLLIVFKLPKHPIYAYLHILTLIGLMILMVALQQPNI